MPRDINSDECAVRYISKLSDPIYFEAFSEKLYYNGWERRQRTVNEDKRQAKSSQWDPQKFSDFIQRMEQIYPVRRKEKLKKIEDEMYKNTPIYYPFKKKTHIMSTNDQSKANQQNQYCLKLYEDAMKKKEERKNKMETYLLQFPNYKPNMDHNRPNSINLDKLNTAFIHDKSFKYHHMSYSKEYINYLNSYTPPPLHKIKYKIKTIQKKTARIL